MAIFSVSAGLFGPQEILEGEDVTNDYIVEISAIMQDGFRLDTFNEDNILIEQADDPENPGEKLENDMVVRVNILAIDNASVGEENLFVHLKCPRLNSARVILGGQSPGSEAEFDGVMTNPVAVDIEGMLNEVNIHKRKVYNIKNNPKPLPD